MAPAKACFAKKYMLYIGRDKHGKACQPLLLAIFSAFTFNNDFEVKAFRVMTEQCHSMLCKGRAKRACLYLQAVFQPKFYLLHVLVFIQDIRDDIIYIHYISDDINDYVNDDISYIYTINDV